MLTEPSIARQSLIEAIEVNFGLSVRSLDFLPIGTDMRSFSYACLTYDNAKYYLKLRQADDSSSEILTTSLYVSSRVENAIHPMTVKNAEVNWLQCGLYKVMLFPFVEGIAGWETKLDPSQWLQVGRTFRSLHDLVLPGSMKDILPREDYSDKWRMRARKYLNGETPVLANDSCSQELQRLLRTNHSVISDIIEKAQELSLVLQNQQLEYVCCHGDLHSGNFLIEEAGAIHPVDWDGLSFAPREKDLMFIGGGIGGMLDEPDSERLFNRGYGSYQISVPALRYFRFERIVEDVVAYCEQLLESEHGGPDREVGLGHFARQFVKGAVVDVAYRT